jgi:hypothetical protein
MCHTRLAALSCLLLWLLICIPATAQNRRALPGRPVHPGAGNRVRPATLRTEGVVKAVRPGIVLMTTAKNENWAVSVPQKLEGIEYHATASPAWLKRNMDVRFSALLDRRGRAQQDVRELTVVTLRQGVAPGLMPEGAPADAQQPAQQQAGQRRAGRGRRLLAVPCLVVGRLLGIRKRTMVVMAGPHRVEAPLAEDAEIKVQMNDYRLARPGDKVEVSARYYPNQPGRAVGQRLVITAARPLGQVAAADPKTTKQQPDKPASEGLKQPASDRSADAQG